MNSMKRSLTILTLSAAMFFAVPFPAYASESVNEIELSLTIPERHTVTMETDSNGSVEVVGGNQEGDTAEVERHASQSYKITPENGYVIDKVYYNGEDVTAQVKDGIFTAPEADANGSLQVTFKEESAEPGTTEPGTTEPGTTEPGTTEPGTTEPGTTTPGTTEPGTTEPGTTEPGTTEPGTTEPGTTEPGTTETGTTEPGTTEPGTTEPGTTEPGTTTPGTSEPGTTESGDKDDPLPQTGIPSAKKAELIAAALAVGGLTLMIRSRKKTHES